jgi:hypothetical protein
MRLSTTTDRLFDEATDAMATCALPNSGPNSWRCFWPILPWNSAAEPLLLGRRGVLRAPDVLPLQVRAVAVELAVRRLERGQRRQRGLVERPDVGDVGRADRRRREYGRAQGEGERGDAAAQRKFSHGWYT